MTKTINIEKRYEENPFLKEMNLTSKGKRISVGSFGDKDNILVNQKTGEQAATHVTAFKKVDNEQFVKLFTKNIAFIFDLSSAGLKALNMVIWTVQNQGLGKDVIPMDAHALDDFLKGINSDHEMSLATMKKGLIDLQKKKILAKAGRFGWYYINPNFIFNGDRIAFTTMIERKL